MGDKWKGSQSWRGTESEILAFSGAVSRENAWQKSQEVAI